MLHMETLADSAMMFEKLLPSAQTTILVAIAFLMSAIYYLVQTENQKKALRRSLSEWLPGITRRRRSSTSATPPRSLTPEKRISDNTSPTQNYRDTFPPSPRGNLPIWTKSWKSIWATLKQFEVDEDYQKYLQENLIPWETDYRKCDSSMYTPMAISIGEVKALGDFPDYSKLSGVPLPEAYKEFEIEKAIPRPYRPFRWAYHQTMSLGQMETEWWLELENSYTERIAERKGLFDKYGKLVLNYLPGSELGCKEIMENALQFLCARYPQYFSLKHSKSKGYVFDNRILKNETVIKDMHPLHVLLENVPEDFAVMLRNPADGKYYFRAGLLCSSLGWNVDTKLGLQLKDIHSPIPDYSNIQLSMDRWFSRLSTDRPIQRGSWGLEIDKPLFMPPGDPHEKYREVQHPELALSRIHLRVDWQTLRRLPLSGAIIFNFKALFTPIEEFRDEPYVPALVAKVLKEGKRSIMEYKNTWHVEHVTLPALEKWAKEQEDSGMVQKDWEVRTLEDSPWFPGWKEKWHRQQGF